MDADVAAKLTAVLESQNRLNGRVAEALAVVDREMTARADDVAELRDELHALANRVESLTRALSDDGRLHSVKV